MPGVLAQKCQVLIEDSWFFQRVIEMGIWAVCHLGLYDFRELSSFP